MTRTHRNTLASLLVAAALLAGCGGDDDGGDASSSTPAESADPAAGDGGATADDGADDLDDALVDQLPEGTVEVPSEDGATTLAEFAAGGSDVEPSDPATLTQVLAIVGTDADGYFTDDAIVVRTTEADATLLCGIAAQLDSSTYTLIPVLPDGTGVDCA